MYVPTYIRMYVHTRSSMHMCTYVYMCSSMHMCKYVRSSMHTCTYICSSMHTCTYILYTCVQWKVVNTKSLKKQYRLTRTISVKQLYSLHILSMCVYMYVHTYVRTYVCTYVCGISMCKHPCMYGVFHYVQTISILACMYVHTYIHMHKYTHTIQYVSGFSPGFFKA